MFSGIIKKVGRVSKVEKNKNAKFFTISASNFLNKIKIGSSISCDGVCLTVIGKKKNSFKAELMPETLKMTKFNNSKPGDFINLEAPLKLGEEIGGHLVMGHIDGTGKVKEVIKSGYNREIIIKIPDKLKKYFVYKGSATVNGVSLTVSDTGKDWFKVSLTSHTLKQTNLKNLKEGDKVNLEIDMIARYLDNLLKN